MPEEQLLTAPVQESQVPDTMAQREFDRLFSFRVAKDRLYSMVNEWEPIVNRAELHRTARKLEVDIKELQRAGELKEDETIIGMRIIAENIKKEQPALINFVRQSSRLCVFTDEVKPSANTQRLEDDFTRGNRYLNWDKPFVKVIDGGQLHGWDTVEIEFDKSRPLAVNISHVGYENLIFYRKARDLQDCEEILRRFELTTLSFQTLASQIEFEEDQVNKIIDKRRQEGDRVASDNIIVYKRFFKYQGIVYVNWMVDQKDDESVTSWLKDPEPLFLGVSQLALVQALSPDGFPIVTQEFQEVPESNYPFKMFFYDETEEPLIIDHEGRYFLDKEKQEAQTALWSVYINGCVRASNIYGSPRENATGSTTIKVLDIALEGGNLYSHPIEFWSPPYPSADILQATNALDVRIAQERGDSASSVINRKDARKTAQELKLAESEKINMSSMPVGNLSTFVSSVYEVVWNIQQSLALQNLIPLLQIPDPQDPEAPPTNDLARLQRKYIVKAAGDIDVVKRQEELEKRFQAWGLVANTLLAEEFLFDILKLMFPDDVERYRQFFQAEKAKAEIIKALSNLLMEAITDEEGNLKPEFKKFAPQLTQLAQVIGIGAQQEQQKQVEVQQ